jgi:hypothetical protein
VGTYVKDALEGRLNQPAGRGAIGRVVAVSPDDKPPRAASVDFGRGYVTGIDFRELTIVAVTPRKQ